MADGNQACPSNLRSQTDFGGESLVVTVATVRWQLERVLGSEIFTRAPRMSRFLRFVVEETLQDRGSQLKEYLIGVEVFDRTDSYDPRADPVVRSEARRLRSKLLEYYEQEGRKDLVRIHLPKGSYAAVFEAPAAGTVEAQEVRLTTRTGSGKPPSIAVLPFLNLSPSPEDDYLSDGLTEEIIHTLGKVGCGRVVARTSVFQYKGKAYDVRQIGEQLHVGLLLEGSVRRFNERLRITTHLIEANDGYSIWSETYDRSMVDVLAVQEELASSIVATLHRWWLGPVKSLSVDARSQTCPPGRFRRAGTGSEPVLFGLAGSAKA